MTGAIDNFADDIFSITRTKPARKLRQYLITWPCGATWEFDRSDLDIPEYRNGEQWGLTWCFCTVREAKHTLESRGCKVEVAA